jgi:hypothetical protein
VTGTIDGAIMVLVIIFTCKKSKHTYIYSVASLLLISAAFEIASHVIINWYDFCHYAPQLNPKCPESPIDLSYFHNLYFAKNLSMALSYCFY